ncbi:MAG: pyridoxal phosphate-dependent aminotransferase [Bryobacteraceae bacterium]
MTHGGDIFAIAARRGWDWREVADFSASINPLGPAPGVRAAICQAIDRIQHYPEREPRRLREALAQKWRVDPDSILLGNGATELIFFLARVFQNRPVSFAAPVFSEFHRAFPRARLARLSDETTWPNTEMLVVTRPANPTGTNTDLSVLRRRLGQSSEPLIVDESFLEFSQATSSSTLLSEFPTLVLLRSLTKFYALPGLRLGALVADASVVAEWRKQREPWQVNVLAEEAAFAAIADEEHARKTVAFVRDERNFLRAEIETIPGAIVHPSEANFIYVTLTGRAHDLVEHFRDKKILVRDCTGWPGLPDEAIRIAVRTRDENERLLKTWKEFSCA